MNCNCNKRSRNRCGCDCGCDQARSLPDCGYYRIDDSGMELARAYVRIQRYENVYDAPQALCRGTAFEDLDMPCW